jgi:hypothetical protein
MIIKYRNLKLSRKWVEWCKQQTYVASYKSEYLHYLQCTIQTAHRQTLPYTTIHGTKNVMVSIHSLSRKIIFTLGTLVRKLLHYIILNSTSCSEVERAQQDENLPARKVTQLEIYHKRMQERLTHSSSVHKWYFTAFNRILLFTDDKFMWAC